MSIKSLEIEIAMNSFFGGVRIQGFVGDKDEFAFPYPARSNVGMYKFLILFTPIS